MIIPELFFLLLPVAAASGWFLARRNGYKPQDSSLPCIYEPDYYKGINFLLNEQPDKAIDVFIHLLEVDSETVETHLALGSLFRKRGEVDRAIRIHQNLIARPSLGQEQRANALLELGMDYMSAGLYDRAENLFTELFETGKLQKKALENLKEIYQQEKVWDKCLQVVKQLESYTHKSYSEEIAHYYCEMADEAKKTGDIQKAENLIKTAKQSKADSVRTLMMEAEFAIKHENYQQALKIYQQILDKDQLFISEILRQMIICYRHVNHQEKLLPFLNDLYDKTQDTAVLYEIVECIHLSEDTSAAIDYLISRLEKHPSLKGLRQLVSLQASLSVNQDLTHSKENEKILVLFKDTIDSVLSSGHAYGCNHCGFAAKTLHWQCPGCRSWGTIKPSREDDKANASSVSS